MGFFKGLKTAFLDYIIPIGLGIVHPGLAAAYSGIKTGIQTGSPLAGLGAGALSFGLSSAAKGLKFPAGGVFPDAASSAGTNVASTAAQEAAKAGTGAGFMMLGDAGSRALQEGVTSGIQTGISTGGGGAFLKGSEGLIKGAAGRVGQGSVSILDKVAAPIGGLVDYAKETVSMNSLGDLPKVALDPTGVITDKQVNPLVMAGLGYGLKEMATPPPPPAPIGNMQAPKRDFSKYAYKGPLDRGKYTYADPEDIAYGRTTNYGYLGAKEGGVIKAQGGGVMMQRGLLDPTIEATKGTFRAPGSMGVVPGKLAQVAQTQPGMMPKPQQMAAMSQPVAPTVPMNMPMSKPQAPMNLPMQGQPNMQGMQQQAQQLINNLPKKDLNVNVSSQLQQAFGQLGLAQGGEVPGMAKNTGQQITGQSSGIGSGVYNNPMSEKQFIDSYLSILPNNLAGNIVRELGLGEQVGQQIYQQYSNSNKKQMAQGGEVESNQELQENAFVIPADVVGHIGDGSSDAGAQRLQGYLGMNPQQYQAGGIMAGELQGPGGGMDDLIQTSIEGKRAAAVSPQEFVVPRDIVAELGQGSYDRGSNKLYALMKNVRKEKTGTTKQPAELQRGLGQLMRTAAA